MSNVKKTGITLFLALLLLLTAGIAGASAQTEGNAASYTVKFSFQGKEYFMPGGSSILLSDLLEELSASPAAAEIQSVSFTDGALLSISRDRADWRVSSLAPFDTEEALTVVFQGGETLTLCVRDPIAGGPFGTNITWEIDNSGVLTLKKTDPSAPAVIGPPIVDPSSSDTRQSYWPWNNYRSRITKVEITDEIRFSLYAGSGLPAPYSWMFYNCVNLESVNISGLDTSNVGALARMFSNCSKLKEADLSTLKNNGVIYNMQNMFNGCSNLEKVIFNNSGFESRPVGSDGVSGGLINGINGMFSGCTKLQYVDMSNLKLHFRKNDSSLRTQFKGKTALETVIMKDAVYDGVMDLRSMFEGCTALTHVDMSAPGGSQVLPDVVVMRDMFKNSFTAPKASALQPLPDGSGAGSLLDASGLGKLDYIVNMDGFVEGCTGLDVLNISNLDNLRIEPLRNRHSASLTDSGAAALNVNWGRDLGLKSCTGLQWILAENSQVWMVYNDKGTAGSPYFTAQTDNEVYYFSQKQMDYYRTGTSSVTATIETKRDYIDMISDREEADPGNKNKDLDINQQTASSDGNGAGILPAGNFHLLGAAWKKQEIPAQPTYYRIGNMANSSPTVSVTVDSRPGQYDGLILEDASGKIHTKRMRVDESGTNPEGYWPATGDYDIQNAPDANGDIKPLITLTYPAAAVDVNGKYHDVIVKINKITFTNLQSIIKAPKNPYGELDSYGNVLNRTHDSNEYWDSLWSAAMGSGYYRPVLEYGTGKLELKNYAFSQVNGTTIIKGDSGTDIEFSIEIKDALPDTSVLFFIDDLDVPATQTYIMGTDSQGIDDACFDRLPWANVSYANNSEGIILGDGNDMNTISRAAHTGVVVEGTYVHGTGPDPSGIQDYSGSGERKTNSGSTYWSGFSVKASADKANYTWTSGIGCTTELLRETPRYEMDPVRFTPTAVKTINGILADRFGPSFNMFDFELTPATEFGANSVDYEYFYVDDGDKNSNTQITVDLTGKLDNLAGLAGYDVNHMPVTTRNNGSSVSFGDLTFSPPLSTFYYAATYPPSDPQYTFNSQGTEYRLEEFPNPAYSSINAVAGYNEHIANAYIYRIKEIPGPFINGVIDYNTAHVTYFLRVVVSGPKNDLEMNRGVRADITLGSYYGSNGDEQNDPLSAAQIQEIQWDEFTQTIWSSDYKMTDRRQQTDRYVRFPQGSSTRYPVKKDQDGVEYIAVPAQEIDPSLPNNDTVYLNANNPYNVYLDPAAGTAAGDSVLLETVTGDIYPYSNQQEKKQREIGHEDKIVSIPLEVNGSPVKKDVHGQMYIADSGEYTAVTVSGSAGTASGALTVEDGVFNPDTSDRQVYVPKLANGYTVREDFMGTEYYEVPDSQTPPRYTYNKPNGTRLSPGSIGQVYPRAGDKTVTRDKTDSAVLMVTHKSTHPVLKDTNGQQYYQAPENGGQQYYDAQTGAPLTPQPGVFDPDPDTDAATGEQVLLQKGYEVKVAGGAVTYYKADDGRYYSIVGTMLTGSFTYTDPQTGQTQTFQPDDANDPLYKTSFDIYTDDEGTQYYQSGETEVTVPVEDGAGNPTGRTATVGASQYYDLNGSPFDPVYMDSDGTKYRLSGYKVVETTDPVTGAVTAAQVRLYETVPQAGQPPVLYNPTNIADRDRSIMKVGTFNNRVKTADITLKKESVDGTKAENIKSDLFAYDVTFDKDFELADYAFDPPAPDSMVTGANGKYKVLLHEGQTVTFYQVTFGVDYTITESLGLVENNNGWEFVDATAWDDASQAQVPQESRTVGGTVQVERKLEYDVVINGVQYRAGDANPDYKGQYDHVYRNRFTEVVLDKIAPDAEEDEEFEYLVEMTVTADMARRGFSYGWMDEDNSQRFVTYQDENAAGDVTLLIPGVPALKPNKENCEDVVLVTPFGARLKIIEDPREFRAFWAVDGGQKTEGNKAEVVADKAPDQAAFEPRRVTFTNEIVTLLVKKNVSGSLGSKDKFFKVNILIEGGRPESMLVLDMKDAVMEPERTNATIYTEAELRANSRDDDPVKKGQQVRLNSSGAAMITVYLQHGQEVAVKRVPPNGKFTVSEEEEGYSASYRTGTGLKKDHMRFEPIAAGNATPNGLPLKDRNLLNAVEFFNELDTPVPTGIYDSPASAFLGLGAAAALLALALLGRGRKKR